MKAASSGPSALPTLPPTWKTDWAKPWRPPDAMRATREDFGMEDRRADADQAGGEQQHAVGRRHRQQQQPAEAEAHADGQRIGLRPTVGEKADERLEERGGHLEDEGDQTDLREVEVESEFLSIG